MDSNRLKIFLILLLLTGPLFAYGRFSKYYGIEYSTTTEKAEMRLRGDIKVGPSTSTVKASMNADGSVTGSTVTAVKVIAAVGEFLNISDSTAAIKADLTAETTNRIAADQNIAVSTEANKTAIDNETAARIAMNYAERDSTNTFTKGAEFINFVYIIPKYAGVYQGSVIAPEVFSVMASTYKNENVRMLLLPTSISANDYKNSKFYMYNSSYNVITEGVRIFSDGKSYFMGGNVGFMNDDPLYPVDVIGDINYTGDLRKNGSIASDSGAYTIQLREAEGTGSDSTTSGTWEGKLTREGEWCSWIDSDTVTSAIGYTYSKAHSSSTDCNVYSRTRIQIGSTYYYGNENITNSTSWVVYTDTITIPASAFALGDCGNQLIELQTKSPEGNEIDYYLGKCHLIIKTEE